MHGIVLDCINITTQITEYSMWKNSRNKPWADISVYTKGFFGGLVFRRF